MDAPSAGPEPPGTHQELTHVDAAGTARMVDIGAKDRTDRSATASAAVHVTPQTARLVAETALPKGDAVAIARVAGIQAAKRTADLIPLCHPIALTSVDVEVDVDVDAGRIVVTATANATDRTGVEMEAMTAAAVAALTIYDLVKSVERGAVIGTVQLERKTGGARGDWVRP
jgi:cyclic pyranopterin phosphate synthase